MQPQVKGVLANIEQPALWKERKGLRAVTSFCGVNTAYHSQCQDITMTSTA